MRLPALLASLITAAWCNHAAARTWRVAPGSGSLQQTIERAAERDTILIEGVIAEGTISIEKPLTLIGKPGAVIDGGEKGHVVLVKADDVTIRGLTVRGTLVSNLYDYAGIHVNEVHRPAIEGNTLDRCFFAIYLSGVQGARVIGNTVIGDDALEERMANGIHLWKCKDATIEGNRIEKHRDGIYFEFVTDSRIERNEARKCVRYGLHFMFSHRDAYTNNVFEENGAGVAVMFSHHITMTGNRFATNRGGSAYGLLLKEINDGEITRNEFTDNTTGIMVDGCNRIHVEHNLFRMNGWALRLYANATSCTFIGNTFSGNTFDMSTNGSLMLNRMEGNYWDRYTGYDLDRDGHGDVPHRPLGFFTMLVERMPHALVFSRSLFVSLLDRAEQVVPSLAPDALKDDRPLMRPPKPQA
ncbi:MAG: nitrous oxide reductase family maturation protein NosD [Flavobacteriales bacterium]|nr:nitrous oxide reductase family maturation protein NosD [Flavobacteriales bacterium]